MNDVTVIDRFLDTFSRYIDSGFGLLQGEVAFLTATLIVIDMTIAGLYWAMSHASGQGDDVIAKLLRKVLYVGAFAYIIGNFNGLASIVFRSFAGLGLTASGSTLSLQTFLQPGQLAKTGIDAGAPIIKQVGEMAGFPEVFVNLDAITVMFIAWFVVILSFFVLAIQLFVTLIEFKLTTLAGFVLVPFALWNKTSFLAEKVLGNVVSSGIKVLVLAVIVGIGSGLFAEFKVHPTEPAIDHALVIMLASLALLALGIFGPGIATGLVSGAPQLGAGAMAGAAVGAAGTAVAIGAAATGAGSAVLAGARMAPAAARLAGAGARAASSTASSAHSAFQAGSTAAGGGAKGALAGLGNVAKTGAQAAAAKVAAPFREGWNSAGADGGSDAARSAPAAPAAPAAAPASAPSSADAASANPAPAVATDAPASTDGGAGASIGAARSASAAATDIPASPQNGTDAGATSPAPTATTAAPTSPLAGAGAARFSPVADGDRDNTAKAQKHEQPAWAKRLQRRQQLTQAVTTTAHTLRGGDGGGSAQGPSLRDSDT